jgi:hypothetical protein
MASREGDAGATRHDDEQAELVAYARVAVGREHGLTAEQSRRLVGRSLTELHGDARAMAQELGVRDPSERTRGGDGRFAGAEGSDAHVRINKSIRQAAGR